MAKEKFNLRNVFIDLLYPRRCPVCGDIVMPKGDLACPSCKKKLVAIQEPRCKQCSKPIDSEEKEYCHDCEKKKYHYVKGYSLWAYDTVMKKSIADFKYRGRREYGDYYIAGLQTKFGKDYKKLSPDVLVPVPIHKSKLIQRGYNQADVLALGLGKELDIPVLSKLLVRDKKTLPQKQLNDKERLKNLEKAFLFSEKEYVKYGKPIRTVMLVDDIYTTGSTIEACTNTLLQNGIEEVYFTSVCIGKGY